MSKQLLKLKSELTTNLLIFNKIESMPDTIVIPVMVHVFEHIKNDMTDDLWDDFMEATNSTLFIQVREQLYK